MRINTTKYALDDKSMLGALILDACAQVMKNHPGSMFDQVTGGEKDKDGNWWHDLCLTINGQEVDLESFANEWQADVARRHKQIIADEAMRLVDEHAQPLLDFVSKAKVNAKLAICKDCDAKLGDHENEDFCVHDPR